MADNTNKLTIDADYFAELYAKAKDKEQYAKALSNIAKERDNLRKHIEDDCASCPAVKERDELKAKLAEHADLLQRTEAERVDLKAKLEEREKSLSQATLGEFNRLREENENLKAKLDCADVDRETYKDRAEAAERCIEDVWNCLSPQEIADNEYFHIDIIRAYRERKEEK